MKLLSQVLGEFRGGVFNNEASKQLRELVKACKVAGKKGTLTVSLTLEPHGENGREMHVHPKLAVKMPAAPFTQDVGVFFATEGGDLRRDDPNQRSLPGVRPVDDDGDEDQQAAAH